MMERVLSNTSPHFVFLGYDSKFLRVRTLLLVPGQFITPSVIEKCPPLSANARRAGWVGCNILTDRIPVDGRLFAVNEGIPVPPETVRRGWGLFQWTGDLAAEKKGWLFDVLRCVRSLGSREFTLDEVYGFADELQDLHPSNRHVRDKIRQQLQMLRDRGIVRFLGRGRYVAV
jgi:type II restriction enzyme